MKPLIGITSGEVYNKQEPWWPYTLGQVHTYVDAVVAAGGVPIVLPIVSAADVVDQMFSELDGILFAGGNDVSPELYGEEPTKTKDASKNRDDFEVALMHRALDAQMPILCICRGMQLLNVVRGGTLYQDVISEMPNAQDHTDSDAARNREHLAHTLTLKPSSRLAHILGVHRIKTNTHHHQAVKKLGKGLVVSARSEDGVVEGVEGRGSDYIMGVQSHPESLVEHAEPTWQLLFDSFVTAAHDYAA